MAKTRFPAAGELLDRCRRYATAKRHCHHRSVWLVALGAWLLFDSAYAVDLFLPLTADSTQVKVNAGLVDVGVHPREHRFAIARDLLSSTRAQVEHGGTSAVSLNVDTSLNFDVLMERTTPTARGYSLSGRVTDGPAGFVTLVVHDETVAGRLWTPEGSYEIVPLGDGAHALRKVNESAHLRCDAVMVAVPPATAETSPEGTDDGSVVDVLVGWTPAAEAKAGGANLIEARIDLAIAFTNDAFRRSGIFTSLNLVGAERVDYEETYSNLDLFRLQDPQDGHLDDLLALRDTVGADLVHLFRGSGGGVAFPLSAFSVSGDVFYFAHEIGHNFGVLHNRNDVAILSYQHAFIDMAFGNGCARTVTSHGGCGVGNGRALPYYSSPTLWDPRNGRPLGVPRFQRPSVLDGPADAVLTINRTRHVVSNFRPSRRDGATVEPAPLSLTVGLSHSASSTSGTGWGNSYDPNSPLGAADLVDAAAVTLPDVNLRRAVEIALDKAPAEPITRGDMARLTELSVSTSVDEGEGVQDLSGLEYASNLASFDAEGGMISDLSPLTGLKHLTYLSLAHNYISDLTPLADIGSLQVLRIGSNHISDLAPLVELGSLTTLSLHDNRISDLASLRNLSSLVAIDLAYNRVHDLSPLSVLESLTELWLGNNNVSDLAPLADLVMLTYLQLGNNKVTDLAPLAANRGLGDGDTLDVAYNPLSTRSMDTHIPALIERGVEVIGPIGPSPDDEEWNAPDQNLYMAVQHAIESKFYTTIGSPVTVPDLARLERLEGRNLGIVDLAGLQSATSLVHLDLSGNSIRDLSPMAHFDGLRRLYLQSNGIADLSPLAGLSLENLLLSNNQIEDITSLADSNLDHLAWLALDGNEISRLPVLDAEWLRYLYLDENAITDITPLASLTTLSELRLNGNTVVSVDALAGMSNLRFLHLNDNQVADISPLNLDSLVELHVKNNAVQDLSRLRNAEKLAMVDVRDNPLSRDSLDVLAELRDAGVTVLAGESVPYFPAAGTTGREGFVRVVNHSTRAGEVFIEAVDDAGRRLGPVRVGMGARKVRHFNSSDLEHGNRAKGLTGIGAPTAGDWRLELVSALDIEVLSYVRSEGGFVTAMHDVAMQPMLPFLNRGGDDRQRGFMRVVNIEGERAMWTSGGYDQRGRWHPMWEGIEVVPGRALTLTSAELETAHGFGETQGGWWLRVRGFPWLSMGLLESPAGHLSNLSTVPDNATTLAEGRRRHRVPLFLEAGGARHGFLRVINRSDAAGDVTIDALDDEGNAGGLMRVAMRPLQTLHLSAGDLESGNAAKGLEGSAGSGEGDWRLALNSELDLFVLAYSRTPDGFLTSMHDVAPRGEDGSHRVVFFNPGSNGRQVSKLRLINDGERAVRVTIAGIDDDGEDSGSATLTVPARRALYVTSAELEAGGGRIQGGLGAGAGKWRLRVTADAPLTVMSLLESPTGHLANVSTGAAD